MSNRDILHNSDVIRTLNKLKKEGLYVELVPLSKTYGILGFDIEKSTEYIIQNSIIPRNKKYVKANMVKDERIIVASIELADYETVPEPKEIREQTAKDLHEKLLRKGIKNWIDLSSDTKAYISIDIDSIANYIGKKAKSIISQNLNTFMFYDKENMILQIHLWTGATPEEVKKLRELVKKK